MTAWKRTVLTCDGSGVKRCARRFLGGLGQPVGGARKAAKLKGWTSHTTSSDMFRVTVDHCPTHS